MILQRFVLRIEMLSQQDRLSKFCADAGSLTTFEIGQYFVTRDTEEFSQFTDSVAVVSTPWQETKIHLNRMVGSERTPKLDPFGGYNLLPTR